jgi:hypothetical protein
MKEKKVKILSKDDAEKVSLYPNDINPYNIFLASRKFLKLLPNTTIPTGNKELTCIET